METLREITENNPDTTQVSLEDLCITDLTEFVPLLAELKNLTRLTLANNRLQELPIDLSTLRKVEYLDLRNNPFHDVELVLSGLVSLPSLKHLHITLPETAEDEIIVSIIGLESLNGTGSFHFFLVLYHELT